MVSALAFRSCGPGSSPGRGHCVEFLGATLNTVLSLIRRINRYWQEPITRSLQLP